MRVLVSDREIEEIKYSQPVGYGHEGICYLTEDDNKIVKLFFDTCKDKFKKISFSNLNNNQIAFPIDILYDKHNRIIGYTMNYINGEKLLDGFSESLLLSNLKQAYMNMRLIILNLKDIYMDDNCLENMIYDYSRNKINIIDTSRWYEKRDGHIESICDFNWQMMEALRLTINFENSKLNQDDKLHKIYLEFQESKNYIEYEKSKCLISLFLEFLLELEKKASEYKGEKVKTIKDLKI